jgi:hypothetical protein
MFLPAPAATHIENRLGRTCPCHRNHRPGFHRNESRLVKQTRSTVSGPFSRRPNHLQRTTTHENEVRSNGL